MNRPVSITYDLGLHAYNHPPAGTAIAKLIQHEPGGNLSVHMETLTWTCGSSGARAHTFQRQTTTGRILLLLPKFFMDSLRTFSWV